MGFKWIRGYNILDSQAGPLFTLSTKSVYGLRADPLNPSRFSSFSEDGIIRIWDISISSPDPIMNIIADFKMGIADACFSPTMSGLLCAIGKDCNILKFWQIQNGNSRHVQSIPPEFCKKVFMASN